MASSSTDASSNPDSSSISPIFQFSDADLIIQTSDKIAFKVHRSIMSLVSRVFRDMLSLNVIPQSSTYSSHQNIVNVSEDSASMDATLRFIYPFPRPVFRTLEPIIILLEIADKYDISIITSTLQTLLLSETDFLENSSSRLYAIAKRLQLLRLERATELILLRHPHILSVKDFTADEQDVITVDDVRKLEFYRAQRIPDVLAALNECLNEDDLLLEPPPCACRRKRSQNGGLEYQDECLAWSALLNLYRNKIEDEPGTDILDPSLREEVIRYTSCRDIFEYFFGEEYMYAGLLRHISQRVKEVPWTYSAEYEEKKKRERDESARVRASAVFTYEGDA
ncbi:hypothetical protein SISSUDRAFT_1123357 [Sistotremastrum suecicum HHB10207 ss-3]|uniref:BTB domain-containing protein n=1 Tax=Sistotremastrum suecicum HHB10207 ss-3 TaxID=1314776 RepID=A0A165XUI7_9AGAM|nr:hypothetical protein SISSUDRAFT_1123357 [Sistotremastrum suecicum HHB10207 ss-3]